MNIKTTLVLLLAVAVVAILMLLNQGKTGDAEKASDGSSGEALITVESKDVGKVAITSADGRELVVQKINDRWRLTKPVDAEAEMWEVDSLVNAIVGIKSQSKADIAGENARATGLDQPRFVIDLWAGEKHWKLAVGEKAAVADALYVRLNDNAKADIVSAELYDKLDRPASALRKMKLIDSGSMDIKQFALIRPDGTIKLQKSGDKWRIVEPVQIAAENSVVDDMLMAVTGLQASEFVSEKSSDAPLYQLDNPRLTVQYTTTPPATQPSATQPTWTSVKFGRYDDVLKKNIFVTVGDVPSIAKVPATVLESLGKKVIDLRDRQIVAIDSNRVSQIMIKTESPAGTKPLTIGRRKEKLTAGPELPATTQATTQPAAPTSKWAVESDPKLSPNDENITTLLGDLNNLRAEKYVEKLPTTQPAERMVLMVTTQGPGGSPVDQYEITLVDPGSGQPVIGSYNGLLFEVSRNLLDHAKAELAK